MKVTKRPIFVISILILIVFLGFTAMKSTDVINFLTPSNSYTKQQFEYDTESRQTLDVYLPTVNKNNKTPILFVYGGAWKEGSKDDYKFLAQALTGLGHPVIIPDYRLYPNVTYPDFITDIAKAIAHLEKNAYTLLNRSLDKIIIMGHSSGAHTAALLTTNKTYLKSQNVNTKIVGLIALAGPYDLPLENSEVKPIFKNATDKDVKPLLNIHSTMPPTLLMHGLDDERVLPFHTQHFEKALLENNIPVKTHLYKGVNHTRIIGGIAYPLRFLNRSYDDIKIFLSNLEK